MDCIDLFKRAAMALQTDSRYLAMDQARKMNDKDEELQNLIGEFNLIRQNLAMEQGKPEEEQNAEKIKELTAKMHSEYNAVMTNENMANFTMAKAGMDKLMSEINTILTYCVEGMDPDTCPSEVPTSTCSGSCATCGGCH